MNLYLRLFFILLFGRFKSKISILDDFKTDKRVMLTDIDMLMHMNNGRYFTIGDLARMEVLIRTGLLPQMKKKRIYAVVAGETAQFRKPLNLFQKYTIITKLYGWDEMFFYIEHSFENKGKVYALLLVKIRFLSTDKANVTLQDIIKLTNTDNQPEIKMNDVMEKWNQSTSGQWSDKKAAK